LDFSLCGGLLFFGPITGFFRGRAARPPPPTKPVTSQRGALLENLPLSQDSLYSGILFSFPGAQRRGYVDPSFVAAFSPSFFLAFLPSHTPPFSGGVLNPGIFFFPKFFFRFVQGLPSDLRVFLVLLLAGAWRGMDLCPFFGHSFLSSILSLFDFVFRIPSPRLPQMTFFGLFSKTQSFPPPISILDLPP